MMRFSVANVTARASLLAAKVRLQGETLPSLTSKPLQELLPFFNSLKLDKTLSRVVDEIVHRLNLAVELGIGYLSLDRRPSTLSNGEAQRVEFVNKLGSQLSGLLYLIDEPTKGLHPQDTLSLIKVLHNLVEKGNTVLTIEHDPFFIKAVDQVIELGPCGGKAGGEILFQGTIKKFLQNKESPTASALAEKIPLAPARKTASPPIRVEKACLHNLSNLTFSLPTEAVVGIIGVSGSGKSTLLFDIIEKAFFQAGSLRTMARCRGLNRLLDRSGLIKGPLAAPIDQT